MCIRDRCEEAVAAGADMAGLDEYVEKIKNGWTDVDVIICTPNVMAKVGALGRILGPRGLMPNPKTGTVTMDVAKACLLYTSDAADERSSVDLGGRRIIKKKNNTQRRSSRTYENTTQKRTVR